MTFQSIRMARPIATTVPIVKTYVTQSSSPAQPYSSTTLDVETAMSENTCGPVCGSAYVTSLSFLSLHPLALSVKAWLSFHRFKTRLVPTGYSNGFLKVIAPILIESFPYVMTLCHPISQTSLNVLTVLQCTDTQTISWRKFGIRLLETRHRSLTLGPSLKDKQRWSWREVQSLGHFKSL